MSIRDVMMTQDIVDKSTLPAGAGDFSRTAFEYSPEILPQVTGSKHAEVLAKFVAPVAGVYKYVFFYKGRASSGPVYIKQECFESPTAVSAYYISDTRYTVSRYNKLDDYYAINTGGIVDGKYYNSSVSTSTAADSLYLWPRLYGDTPSYTEHILYFSARKGEAIALIAVAHSSDANTLNRYSIKNQKITY